ncbi:endoglucanase, partial [Lachnotalea glycerini]
MRKIKKIASFLSALMLTTCCISNTQTIYAADTNQDDWLHCEGNKIYDSNNNEVWLTGANWFGFNCGENVLHGAWYDIESILTEIANRGIGLLRIPISSELLYSWMAGTPNAVSSVTAANDPPYFVGNSDFY